jgi:diguanylate cyclase (GGDEF)-like protein
MIDPQRIWTSPQLPTLPAVAVRLLELMRDPEAELRQIIDVIRKDPALSAKLVRAANSSMFGFRHEIKSLDRAVTLLGPTVATSLCLSFSLTDDACAQGPLRRHYQDYWQQSLIQAAAADTLARQLNPKPEEDFFLCGLLQDLGRLAMLRCLGADYVPVLSSADLVDTPLHFREAAVLGFDHIEVGAKLMQHWQLPEPMVRAVSQHHAPLDALVSPKTPEQRLAAGLALAASVGDYFCSSRKGAAVTRMRKLADQAFGISQSELEDSFLPQCEDRIRKTGHLFDVELCAPGSSAELMVQANEQLAQLALREHVSNTHATLKQQLTEQEKQELESRNRELRQRVLHDPLTGIYNRALFEESLQKEVERSQRHATPLAVLFVDIDHFKAVNDTHGHAVGDEVLKLVAATLQGAVRSSDVLARYGGEEFVVLVHQPAEKGLQRLADRLRQAVAAVVLANEAVTLSVTCSVGAAIALPGRKEVDVGAKLLAAADECLYQAKRAGRNRIQFRSLISPADRELQQMVAAQRFSRWLVNEQVLDLPGVSRALINCQPSATRLGELGLDAGFLTFEQIDNILREQEACGDRFGEIAVRQGALDQQQLARLLALQHENPRQLASVIIRLGLLTPQQATMALERFRDSQGLFAAVP